VIPIREPTVLEQNAIDIAKDTDSATEAIEGTKD
jgi:hypothetical protein